MLSKRSFVTLLVAAALALTPVLAAAQTTAPPAAADQTQTGVGAAEAGGDSWMGGVAAIGCGIMIRATIYTAGTQVGTIAGAIACCGFAMFDAFFLDGPRG